MKKKPEQRKYAVHTLAEYLSAQSFKSSRHLANEIFQCLHEIYGYSPDWIKANAELVEGIKDESGKEIVSNISGIVFHRETSLPYFLLLLEENNQPATEDSLRRVFASCDWLAFGGYTNGSKSGTGFLRKNFFSSKLEFVPDMDKHTARIVTRPFTNLPQMSNDAHSLVPLNSKIEEVFFEILSHLRDIDGLYPDDALDELCKLIYAKIYDEENTRPRDNFRFQRWIYSSGEELAFSIRQLYREACDYDLRVFRLKIPQYERSRGVFNTPLRLSSAAIQKSVETLEAYALSLSEADVKGRAFQKVLDRAVRYGMGQYFTPEPVVRLVTAVCSPLVTELILDPFCGSAHFLTEALKFVRQNTLPGEEKMFHEFAFGKLHGIEKSDRMVRIAMTDMRLHGDGHSNIRCTDALADFANFADISPESFDLILTNPPFGSIMSRESIERLGFFELGRGRKNVPLEILGIERCVQFLRPGGRMAIVLPDSILSNKNTAYVREWLAKKMKLRAIVSLPREAFAPFGANVKTSVLFARKWMSGESKDGEFEIFLGRIDNLGYDAAGRTSDTSDVKDMAEQIKRFFSQEGW